MQEYLQAEFILLKSQCFWENRTELMKQFSVAWTPTLLVLDQGGRERHRVVGFVPTDDFLAHLKLGKGKIFFEHFRFGDALEAFAAVIGQHPQAGVVPEAIFFQGVAGYWKGHDATALRRAYDTLTAKFPASEWARRATPYAKIPL